MNKLAYLILNVLKNEDAVNGMSSMSAADVHFAIAGSRYSYSAVYKKLKELIIMGHVARGIKDGNSNTYFVTSSGIKTAESLRNQEVTE